MTADFTRKLMRWNQHNNKRLMPWKGEKDPYKIWLSEIILQQTRVEQGLQYYEQFIKKFPTIEQLAKAPEQKVFKLWEGLGYYTRCKNLIATAIFIVKEKKGIFPNKYEDILQLKGIGPYTAAAIASFAFNLPYAVLDGNVFRVLSRYFGISTPIDTTNGKKLFTQIANTLLEKKKPGLYNQAIMDFGAIICKPKQPLCLECPHKNDCRAFAYKWINFLPIKEKQLKKQTRWFYYFIVYVNNAVLIRKRTARDIWENLFEFVLYESNELLMADQKSLDAVCKIIFGEKNTFIIKQVSQLYTQKLTHQTIIGQFISIEMGNIPTSLKDFELVKTTALKKYAFPRFITAYLQQHTTPLALF